MQSLKSSFSSLISRPSKSRQVVTSSLWSSFSARKTKTPRKRYSQTKRAARRPSHFWLSLSKSLKCLSRLSCKKSWCRCSKQSTSQRPGHILHRPAHLDTVNNMWVSGTWVVFATWTVWCSSSSWSQPCVTIYFAWRTARKKRLSNTKADSLMTTCFIRCKSYSRIWSYQRDTISTRSASASHSRSLMGAPPTLPNKKMHKSSSIFCSIDLRLLWSQPAASIFFRVSSVVSNAVRWYARSVEKSRIATKNTSTFHLISRTSRMCTHPYRNRSKEKQLATTNVMDATGR